MRGAHVFLTAYILALLSAPIALGADRIGEEELLDDTPDEVVVENRRST